MVSAWSISEGIFHCGDFYRAPKVPEGTNNGLIDVRCDACFVYPAQLPPKTDLPTEVFIYNLCQGTAGNPDPKTETYGKDLRSQDDIFEEVTRTARGRTQTMEESVG